MTGDNLTEAHPRAADKNAIIEWTLNEFSKLKVPKKILLLQYAKDHAKKNAKHRNVPEERNFIKKTASGLNISVIDPLDELTKYPPKQLWKAHHTARGNEVVCEYLFEKAFGTVRCDSC